MEVKILRDELTKCQRAEGVNSLEACKYWREKLIDTMQKSKVCDGFHALNN